MNKEIEKIQNILSWVKQQIFLDTIADKAKSRKVKRGEIYHCNFGFGIGSEIQKERPCVIIQNDIRNFNSGTVIVAPITHEDKLSYIERLKAERNKAQDDLNIVYNLTKTKNITEFIDFFHKKL